MKHGMTASSKIALAIALVLVIVGGTYLALGPNPLGTAPNSTKATSSSSSASMATSGGEPGQTSGIIDLFGNFTRMAITTSYSDFASGEVQQQGAVHLSYAVLGREVLNSTNYYKVELTNLDDNTSEVAWFNPQGTVDRVDVVGGKNYTGLEASLFAEVYISTLSLVPSISYNATLLSGLQKMKEGVQSFGPTQMDVVTYGLAAPTSAYNNYTVKIATVPGTNFKLAVYLYQELPSTSNKLLEVTSVTRA